MPKISNQEFENLARLILETAGIQLDEGKDYLLKARLAPILERHGLDSYSDLYNQAVSDATGKFKAAIIDAITINETYFFRDKAPFDLLKNKIIPDLIDQKSTVFKQQKIPLKIWSAACSTGQEVYSLGMMLKEMSLGVDRFDITILGTDISNEAIAKASYGKYSQFEIERGLSSHYVGQYFTKLATAWKIKDEIRSMACFSQMDLNKSFTGLGSFDIILCRNVAIYFPVSGKITLFQKLATVLNPHGALIVGGSESLAGLANDFVPRHHLNSVFYQLRTSDTTKPGAPQLGPYRQAESSSSTKKTRVSPPVPAPSHPKPAATRSPQNKEVLPAAETPEPDAANPVNSSIAKPGEAAEPTEKKPEKKSLLETLHSQSQKADTSMFSENPQEKTEKNSLLEKLNKEKKD
jgi:chemotaxis protein methyltransferase CheR